MEGVIEIRYICGHTEYQPAELLTETEAAELVSEAATTDCYDCFHARACVYCGKEGHQYDTCPQWTADAQRDAATDKSDWPL